MHRRIALILLLSCPVLTAGCADLQKRFQTAEASKKENAVEKSRAEAPPPPRINPMTHVAAGQMLEQQGDFNGAIEQYEKAVAANPKTATGYNRLGVLYQKLGRFEDADQMFRQGLAVQPGSAMLHNNLGYNYLIQKKYFEAEQSFRDALSLSRDFKRARMNLAISLAQQGRLDESVLEFSRVLPEDVAHFNVATLCLQKGDYANSEASLRQALMINPDCPGAKDQLQRVIRLAAANSPAPKPTLASPSVTPLAGNSTQEPGAAP